MPPSHLLQRSSSLVPALGLLFSSATALAQPAPAEPAPSGPAPAHRIMGEPTSYQPLLHFKLGPVDLEVPLSLAAKLDGVSTFPVDRFQTPFSVGPALSPELRVGVR
ncbi:MAG: hypothetical protein ABI193_18070, partial [Minicystis sp.]